MAESSKLVAISITLTVAAISASTAISVYLWRKKSRDMDLQLQELQISLKAALKNCTAERQGRIRAQQDLRKALCDPVSEKLELASYPMAPIATVRSCFSTRNGTPRQPLLVPLARATLVFDSARVPPASLEGLEEYSHCWIIYVFHLNTNLEKLWKHPSKSGLKAKVKVPSLKGGKMGLFATRSPHRPCPIGLTVAKVEAVKTNMVLLSGADLVDGTPVLDIKPYLPYSDSIHGAKVPKWVEVDNPLAVASVNFAEGFFTTLAECWKTMENKSLYESPDEFRSLIKQVLSWDIRSLSQRNEPRATHVKQQNGDTNNNDFGDGQEEEDDQNRVEFSQTSDNDIIYHLILESVDVAYKIDSESNVHVCAVTVVDNYDGQR